jgi:hypothetical protein
MAVDFVRGGGEGFAEVSRPTLIERRYRWRRIFADLSLSIFADLSLLTCPYMKCRPEEAARCETFVITSRVDFPWIHG